MSLGQYARKFTLKAPITTNDGKGGQDVVSYLDVMDLWGRFQAVSAREQARDAAVQTVSTHRVTTHYRSAIVSTQRLVPKGWTGPTLEIVGVSPDEWRREVVLDCMEVI